MDVKHPWTGFNETRAAFWARYDVPGHDEALQELDGLVLDIGAGTGETIRRLAQPGARIVALEMDRKAARSCLQRGLETVRARAEELPFCADHFDWVVCGWMLPYTDEGRVIREIGRVLRSGGKAVITTHGAGYYLRYALRFPARNLRLFGLRALLNTFWFVISGRRLFPGNEGDVAQSERCLKRHFAASGLALIAEVPSPRFCGLPVFLCYTVVRGASPSLT